MVSSRINIGIVWRQENEPGCEMKDVFKVGDDISCNFADFCLVKKGIIEELCSVLFFLFLALVFAASLRFLLRFRLLRRCRCAGDVESHFY